MFFLYEATDTKKSLSLSPTQVFDALFLLHSEARTHACTQGTMSPKTRLSAPLATRVLAPSHGCQYPAAMLVHSHVSGNSALTWSTSCSWSCSVPASAGADVTCSRFCKAAKSSRLMEGMKKPWCTGRTSGDRHRSTQDTRNACPRHGESFKLLVSLGDWVLAILPRLRLLSLTLKPRSPDCDHLSLASWCKRSTCDVTRPLHRDKALG